MNGRTAILIAAYAASSLPAQEGGIEIFTGETLIKEMIMCSMFGTICSGLIGDVHIRIYIYIYIYIYIHKEGYK